MSPTSFKDFIDYRRTFIALGVSAEQNQELIDFKRIYGIENNRSYSGQSISPEEFYHHITVMYSRKGQASPTDEPLKEKVILQTDGWELLGPKKDALTIKFKPNVELENMFKYYKIRGLVSDWPTFKPHLSLAYGYDKKKVPRISPPSTITFDALKIEETYDLDKARLGF